MSAIKIKPKNGETASEFVIRFKNKQRALALYLECRAAVVKLRQANTLDHDFSKCLKPLLLRDINRQWTLTRRHAIDAKYAHLAYEDEVVASDVDTVTVAATDLQVTDIPLADDDGMDENDDIPIGYLKAWFNPV